MQVELTDREIQWIAPLLIEHCDKSTRIFEISALRTIMAKLGISYTWNPSEHLTKR